MVSVRIVLGVNSVLNFLFFSIRSSTLRSLLGKVVFREVSMQVVESLGRNLHREILMRYTFYLVLVLPIEEFILIFFSRWKTG